MRVSPIFSLSTVAAGVCLAYAGVASAAPAVSDTQPDHWLLAQTTQVLDLNRGQEAQAELPAGRWDEQLLTWGGLRPKLEEAGISFEGSWIADGSRVFTGGGDAGGNTFRSLLDLRLNFDLGKIFDIEGGTVSLDFQHHAGSNGTDVLGDVQGYDNIDADGRTQLAEFWYEQWLADRKLRIKVGKVDANSEFAFPEYGGEFINSSFGVSPTLLNLPTYPDPAMSFNIFAYPTESLYIGYGIYNGALADGITTGDHSPKSLWEKPHHFFQIAEAGVRWSLANDTLPGRFAAGGWYENADFDTFSGGTRHHGEGFYLIAEQKLLAVHSPVARDDDADRGVFGFLQYGWAEPEISDVAQHFGGGLVWVGPFGKDNPDSVGVGFTTAFLSQADGSPYTTSSETSLETFYNWQATPWLSIKPDLQYIFNPGGDASLDDALVGTLRVTLTF